MAAPSHVPELAVPLLSYTDRGEPPVVDVVFNMPGGGKITFYVKSQLFEAHCRRKDCHDNACRKTKKAYESRHAPWSTAFNESQGRPLAWLISWILDDASTTRASHVFLFKPTETQRMSARKWINDNADAHPVIRLLGAAERKPRADESIEPPGEP